MPLGERYKQMTTKKKEVTFHVIALGRLVEEKFTALFVIIG